MEPEALALVAALAGMGFHESAASQAVHLGARTLDEALAVLHGEPAAASTRARSSSNAQQSAEADVACVVLPTRVTIARSLAVKRADAEAGGCCGEAAGRSTSRLTKEAGRTTTTATPTIPSGMCVPPSCPSSRLRNRAALSRHERTGCWVGLG